MFTSAVNLDCCVKVEVSNKYLMSAIPEAAIFLNARGLTNKCRVRQIPRFHVYGYLDSFMGFSYSLRKKKLGEHVYAWCEQLL